MSSKNTESGVAAISSVESPGRILAAARESQSLSPADLAGRLRLDTKIVMALERDDFENLPAPTFIKGYIRSIAKELDIDPQTILETYEAHAMIEPPALADFSSRAPEQVGINSTIIRAITYSLAVLLIVLIALWWRSNYQNGSSGNDTMSRDEIAVESKAEPLSYTYPIVEHGQGWRVAAQDSAVQEDDNEPGEIVPSIEVNSDLQAQDLSISTTSEAWVEVYDANDNRLYVGLAKNNKPVEINGGNYYRLILGNTSSITLRLNGKEIDLDPHSQEGVAQLELGKAPNGDNTAR